MPTTDLPTPFYRPTKPKPFLAYLNAEEAFFLPNKPDTRKLRRIKPLLAYAEALARATEGLNWAVQQADGSWPQEYADRKQHNRFSGQWESVGSLPVKACLLALSGYSCSVGTSDRPGLALKDLGPERFDRAASRMSFRCIRLDVDCDEAFDRQDLEALRAATDAVREAFASTGLTCSIWSTGGRGVQAVAPCQPLTWHELRTAERYLKDLLTETLPAGAKADKAGTEGILRLPFGLHPKTGRLGLFVDADCRTLPLEQQLGAMTAAYGRSASDLPPVAAVRTSRAQEPLLTRARAEATPEAAPARRGRDGTGAERWQRLRDERPEPGGTYEWLNAYGRVHAFVWAFGREGARQRLHEVMEETPLGPRSDMQDRHARVDALLDTYVDFGGRKGQEPPKDLHEDDEADAELYRQSLKGRKDFVSRQHAVYRAFLHARRTWGDAVDGGDVCRMFKHLYGKVAPKTVYRALDAMREKINICSVTLSLEDLADTSGYVLPPMAIEEYGYAKQRREADSDSRLAPGERGPREGAAAPGLRPPGLRARELQGDWAPEAPARDGIASAAPSPAGTSSGDVRAA